MIKKRLILFILVKERYIDIRFMKIVRHTNTLYRES